MDQNWPWGSQVADKKRVNLFCNYYLLTQQKFDIVMNIPQALKILNNNNLAKNSIKMKTKMAKPQNKNLYTFQIIEKNVFIQNYVRKIVPNEKIMDLFSK